MWQNLRPSAQTLKKAKSQKLQAPARYRGLDYKSRVLGAGGYIILNTITVQRNPNGIFGIALLSCR